MAKVKMSDKTDAQLQAMLHKNSGASVREVKSALSELKKRGLPTPPEKNVTGGREYAKGGDAKKVPVITIGVGMAEFKKGKGKAKMMRGGMANKKEHMYSNGGAVTDNLNPGLRALQKERPDVVAKILKKS
tara:strand:- start:1290 stop:1682 length:393 start_codon:yes stop_codon:yes gene_type:complete